MNYFSPGQNRRLFGCSRNGASLLELLVVISVVSVLLGLVMVAVVRVRSAATRMACANNLRQIVLSLASYHNAFASFPSGSIVEKRSAYGTHFSWLGLLLPYVGQNNLASQAQSAFQTGVPFIYNPPHSGLPSVINTFICPADLRVRESQATRHGIRVAFTSYLGVEGASFQVRDGLFYADSRVRAEDVLDGLSNTIAVGERPPSSSLQMGWWYAGVGQDGKGSLDELLGTRELQRGATPRAICPIGPYHFSSDAILNPCSKYHFWSLHEGGGNFAFGDGSVRFLRYESDLVLPSLSSIAGSEVVGDRF
jgi:prepilin-type processing-associated H-X9-DG protein